MVVDPKACQEKIKCGCWEWVKQTAKLVPTLNNTGVSDKQL